MLHSNDTASLSKYIQCAASGSQETAGALADKALDAAGGRLPRAANALNGMLLNAATIIATERPWLDKFIDWRNLLRSQAVRGSTREEVRQRFITAIHRIQGAVAPFVRLDTCGLTSREIQTYVLTHIDEAVTVNSVGAALYFSSHYLSKKFKSQTGITLGDYITEMKVARARLLMGQGKGRVAGIAGLLGFRDVAYFSRLFREQVGKSPTEYRRSLVWF